MGKYSTKNLEVKQGESQYITYGISNLMFNDIQVRWSSNKDNPSYQIVFSVESEAIKTTGFKPADTATNGGKVGVIKTSYVKPDSKQEEELIHQINIMADKFDVKAQLDSVSEKAESPEELISGFLSLVKGKFLRFKVCTDQDYNNEGKIRNSLKFARFGFCERIGDEQKMVFDPKSQFDINTKKLVKPDTRNSNNDDLPF